MRWQLRTLLFALRACPAESCLFGCTSGTGTSGPQKARCVWGLPWESRYGVLLKQFLEQRGIRFLLATRNTAMTCTSISLFISISSTLSSNVVMVNAVLVGSATSSNCIRPMLKASMTCLSRRPFASRQHLSYRKPLPCLLLSRSVCYKLKYHFEASEISRIWSGWQK